MKRWPLWIIVAASLAGMIGSLLATDQYFQIVKFGFENKSFCSINSFINCDAAYATSYAKLFGIPVAWLGFLFYAWTAGLALWILFKDRNAHAVASFGWVMAFGSLLMSVQKAYVSFVVLKVLCLICASMYLVNIILFVMWQIAVKKPSFSKQWQSLGLITAGIFGAGYFVMFNYQDNLLKTTRLNLPAKEIVAYHYRQSEYQFDLDTMAPVWGNPAAKVTLVEFSDFQCPFCKHAAFHLKPVLEEFKNKVRLYYYHYPIDQACNDNIKTKMHENSCLAAEASVCAQSFGDFWGYHDELFRNQQKIGLDLLIDLAKQKGWDVEKFNACIAAPETLAKVKQNIAAANKIYVEGTPTVLLNNRRVKYWTDPDIFRALLKEEIKRKY